MDSPKSKKGALAQKKKDLKLYTMKIEQFLSHINVNEEEEPISPTKMTDMSQKKVTEQSPKKSMDFEKSMDKSQAGGSDNTRWKNKSVASSKERKNKRSQDMGSGPQN